MDLLATNGVTHIAVVTTPSGKEKIPESKP